MAVALDTFQNGADPSGNFVGIATGGTADALTWVATSSEVPALRPGTHHVDVRSSGGRLTVTVDGIQALERLRTDARTAAIPVIAVTAQAMHGDRERFLGAGFVDYLSKPVDIIALLRIVGELVRP